MKTSFARDQSFYPWKTVRTWLKRSPVTKQYTHDQTGVRHTNAAK